MVDRPHPERTIESFRAQNRKERGRLPCSARHDRDRPERVRRPRATALLHDLHLLEQVAHFNKEKDSERQPHCQGAGAIVFETTEDVSRDTGAALFQPGMTREPVPGMGELGGAGVSSYAVSGAHTGREGTVSSSASPLDRCRRHARLGDDEGDVR